MSGYQTLAGESPPAPILLLLVIDNELGLR
jgi:hypothetical protein